VLVEVAAAVLLLGTLLLFLLEAPRVELSRRLAFHIAHFLSCATSV